MKIEIERINDAVNLKAKNEFGNEILMDGAPEYGGQDLGFRPMQLLLAALGGCGSMDVLNILKKQKQKVDFYKVVVEGDRQKQGEVSLYSKINVHFILHGNLDKEKVDRAISIALNKYCSVSKTLEPTAQITHTFEIHPS